MPGSRRSSSSRKGSTCRTSPRSRSSTRRTGRPHCDVTMAVPRAPPRSRHRLRALGADLACKSGLGLTPWLRRGGPRRNRRRAVAFTEAVRDEVLGAGERDRVVVEACVALERRVPSDHADDGERGGALPRDTVARSGRHGMPAGRRPDTRVRGRGHRDRSGGERRGTSGGGRVHRRDRRAPAERAVHSRRRSPRSMTPPMRRPPDS